MVGYDKILEALEAGRRPEMAETIDLYRKLIECQRMFTLPANGSALSAEEATNRLEQGQPLLSPETVEIDSATFAQLCSRAGFALAEQQRELVKPLALIHAWLRERRGEIGTLAADYLREGHVSKGEEAGLKSPLLSFIFTHSLRPLLRAQAAALSGHVNDSRWYRGRCPICGGEPDIAALERGSGLRRLLCSRCDSEWPTYGAPAPSAATKTRRSSPTTPATTKCTGSACASAAIAI